MADQGFRKFPTKQASTPPPTPPAKLAPPKASEAAGTNKNPDRLGAAWYAKTKKGEDYIRIKLDDGQTLILLVNTHKEKENQPDFNVLKARGGN